jgi:hypothetical protein
LVFGKHKKSLRFKVWTKSSVLIQFNLRATIDFMNGVLVLRSNSVPFKSFKLALFSSSAEYLLYPSKKSIPG